MFKSARIKLTAWYLLILMFVSILFSFIIYQGANAELERISHRQRVWTEGLRDEFFMVPGRIPPPEPVHIEELRQNLLFSLIIINSVILIVAGGAGYFLSGRTLKPIKKMIDEQNRFIADASHELRTPLTALKTITEVGLRDKKITVEEAKNILGDSLGEINNLNKLSDDLLRLSQFEKANGNFVLKKVYLPEVFQEVQKKMEPFSWSKKIKLEFSKANYYLNADKESLVELLVILLDNAIKYSPNKTSVVVNTIRADGKITIKVTDQGIGIDRKDIPHIFDRFYRADKARSRGESFGYGLGLSIAKKIVDLHRGTIEVKSEVNKGTSFMVNLPIITS